MGALIGLMVLVLLLGTLLFMVLFGSGLGLVLEKFRVIVFLHNFTANVYLLFLRNVNVSGVRNPISTEPNQALQRINMLVTDHAPSSMLRAKHVYR